MFYTREGQDGSSKAETKCIFPKVAGSKVARMALELAPQEHWPWLIQSLVAVETSCAGELEAHMGVRTGEAVISME
ncbi:hypothetical protein CLCR_06496 [Cladophialophora carrionii]|uniref:Uncharacterized protein n=1 Tax=Cladophialophora carrionii TaxID=86049 RepID=A0A1C1C9F9_9EURO|nr:hypothetical protein CLCR_06496 [Cladophialophora carrionii]